MWNAQIMSEASPRERPCRLMPAYMELMLYHPLPQGLHTKLQLGWSAGFWSGKKKNIMAESFSYSFCFFLIWEYLFCIVFWKYIIFYWFHRFLQLRVCSGFQRRHWTYAFEKLAIDPLLDELMDYKMWMWFWGSEVECYDLKWYIWYWIDRK